jgi:hypothetical protein
VISTGQTLQRRSLLLDIFFCQGRCQGEDGRLEHTLPSQNIQERTDKNGFGGEYPAVISYDINTIIQERTHECLPTTMAHALINTRGTRLHHSTNRTPNFSAKKLNGIVTRKSSTPNISHFKISRHQAPPLKTHTHTHTAHNQRRLHDTLQPGQPALDRVNFTKHLWY